MIKLAAALAGLFALAATPQTAPADLSLYAKPQRLVTLPDGRRMNVHCTGSGAPTVILEGGWTTNTIWWRDIQPRVATTTRVCSYDRAGYGFSDAGPMPRTAGRIAGDLEAMLKAANIAGPYIVVAHSLGGLDARIFADRNLPRVKGMLLIDPSTPHMVRRMDGANPGYAAEMTGMVDAVAKCAEGVATGALKAGDPGSRACIDPPSKTLPAAINDARRAQQLSLGYQRTAASELSSIESSSSEVDASRRLWGKMPVIVLTAGQSNASPDLPKEQQAKLDAEWWAMHEEAARLSTRGSHRLVPASSHFIPKDNPDLVVAAIEELIRAAR
ncbi:MAG: alpha/beta hydrolase [Sphingomonadales bacterium]|nr:MAG: alpha/beta hydrolase [Sphingomonadales bacterium]